MLFFSIKHSLQRSKQSQAEWGHELAAATNTNRSNNLQGNASSFKHSQQFLRKNCFRKVKHYMQHILSSSISSYISLGIKCISPMTTAYHPCLIQLVHSTLFIHMNIFAKFRFYALPSSWIMVHELQYSNIYYSPVYLCSYCSTTIVIIPK